VLARIRKALIVLFGVLMAAAVAACVLAWSEIKRLSPQEINKRITEAVKAETGLDLISGKLSTTISYHVIVTLESARLLNGHETVARFNEIRLVCGYRTLLFHRGLPFIGVSMDRPTVVLPVHSVTPGPMPVLDAASVRNLRRILVRLSNVTRRIVMSTATVEDHDGRVLFDEAAVEAIHARAAGAWRLRLEGLFRGVALPSFKVGASLMMAPEIDGPEVPFARGALWFWDAQLQDFVTRGITLKGNLEGNLSFLVRPDGTVRGRALTHTKRFELSGPLLARPVQAKDLALSASLTHSYAGLELNQFAMSAEGQELFSGSVTVTPIPPDNLRIHAHLSPLNLSAQEVKTVLLHIRNLPAWVSNYAPMVSAGRMALEQLNLNTTLKELEAPSPRVLMHQVEAKAALDGLAFNLPEMPPVAELDGWLDYAGGLLRLTQSHASFGASTLNQISLSSDLGHGGNHMPYQVKVVGDFDVGEIFAALRHRLPSNGVEPLRRVDTVNGRADAQIEMHGQLEGFELAGLPEYRAVVNPLSVSLGIAAAPSELRLYGGAIIISPGEIVIDKLDLAPRHGSMSASGRIKESAPGGWQLISLELALRQVQAEEWLPKLIAMDTMDVHAPTNGTIAISSIKEGGARDYQVNGSLALGPGQIKFAFLRSPVIVTEPATVTLSGHGGKLEIKSGKLEGSPLQMTVAVPDARHPVIRLDGVAQRLDLEAIAAVRLPWKPKTPVKMDNTPFEGHIEARQAVLERLEMKNLRASFRHNEDDWRVFDLNADAMDGHIVMDLAGHRLDDWVHIIANVTNVDMVALQDLAGMKTVVTGGLSSEADLWADTNSDFFTTLTGSLSATIKDGILLKFKLVSRMLSLVDVSEWLNASVPNPLVKGVPFKTITAHFVGEQGRFETSDFMLDGPVMKITAAGKVDVAQSAMNMMIGMRPFQLLDTVFNKIPVIGSRLAQSQSGIVAAYFHVQGPVADPSVVPAPITSISHLVIKTLAIPINLLVPETVR
jgi:AsmA-like C-terminal region